MSEMVPDEVEAQPPTEATADLSHGERQFPKETDTEVTD